MADQPSTVGSAASRTTDAPEMPPVVDRATFQAQLDRLRAREKAHTHESDAIAAARRRLPMVEMEPSTPLIGPQGPVTLPETFEGRRHLIAYYFMWHSGHPAAGQCEGCTWVTTQVADLSYLHSRDMVPAIDTPSLAVGAPAALPLHLRRSRDRVLQAESTVIATPPDRATLIQAFAAVNAECLRIGVKPSSG